MSITSGVRSFAAAHVHVIHIVKGVEAEADRRYEYRYRLETKDFKETGKKEK